MRPPKGFYVKNLKYGDREVNNGLIEVTSAGGILNLTIARTSARLRVSLAARASDNRQSGGDRVSIGAYCVLAPLASGSSEVLSGYFDEHGRFEVSSIAPGRYLVLAQTSPDPRLWNEISAMMVVDVGTEISVGEGEAAEAVVRISHKDDLQSHVN